jgi:hypothetical protein
VQRFGVKGKLAPHYVGQYDIIEEYGPMAYRVRLPSQLAAIHDVFHGSQLKICVKVLAEIVEQKEIMVEPNLSYVEQPIKILDQKERSTRRTVIKIYKIQWNHHTEEEATWETESCLHQNFSSFLDSIQGTHFSHLVIYSNLGTRLFLRGLALTPWVSKRLNKDP